MFLWFRFIVGAQIVEENYLNHLLFLSLHIYSNEKIYDSQRNFDFTTDSFSIIVLLWTPWTIFIGSKKATMDGTGTDKGKCRISPPSRFFLYYSCSLLDVMLRCNGTYMVLNCLFKKKWWTNLWNNEHPHRTRNSKIYFYFFIFQPPQFK